MTAAVRPGPLDPRLDDALAAIEAAWRRYCSACNRQAPDSTVQRLWWDYRRTQRAFHDVNAEIQAERR